MSYINATDAYQAAQQFQKEFDDIAQNSIKNCLAHCYSDPGSYGTDYCISVNKGLCDEKKKDDTAIISEKLATANKADGSLRLVNYGISYVPSGFDVTLSGNIFPLPFTVQDTSGKQTSLTLQYTPLENYDVIISKKVSLNGTIPPVPTINDFYARVNYNKTVTTFVDSQYK